MASQDKGSSGKVKRHAEEDEKKAKKRKRKHHEDQEQKSKRNDGLANGTKSPEDHAVEQEEVIPKVDSEKPQDNSPGTPVHASSYKSGGKFRLHLKFPSPILRTPKSLAAKDSTQNESLVTPSPTSPSPMTSSTKKVVKFKDEDDDSDDDADWSPPTKRKKSLRSTLKSSSPRHGQSPNGIPLSPKKVQSHGKLVRRQRDLLDERMKLPIWTGTYNYRMQLILSSGAVNEAY